MTIRMYTKVLNIWKAWQTILWKGEEKEVERVTQREYGYCDYDMDTHQIVGTGSEDFSAEREKMMMGRYWVWTWDGKKRRKDGLRWWDCQYLVTINKKDKKLVEEFYRTRYNAELCELR